MTGQEAETSNALERLHQDLGALFRTCHIMLERGLGAGDTYLFAVAARELTNGVVRSLDIIVDASIWEETLVADNEKHRSSMGQVLGLPPNDSMITLWLVAHQEFNRACHWGHSVSPASLVAHFRIVSEILVTRLGPFFETQDEIDGLAALAAPTADDAARLRSLLLLPVQREHFFHRVISPEWLEHLESFGAFARLPRAPTAERWRELARWTSWPEGVYLERIAGSRPDEVRRILLGPPSQSANPWVWARILKAGVALPAEHASAIAAAYVRKVASIQAEVVAIDALRLSTYLLQAKQSEGLTMLIALMGLSPSSSGSDRLASEESAWRSEREPFFGRLPSYLSDMAVETAIPAAIEYDSVSVARWLGALTKRAIEVAVTAGARAASSKSWCRGLDERHGRSGRSVRGTLLRAFARALVQAAKDGPPDAIDPLLTQLSEETHDAFARVFWHVLAEAGQSYPVFLARAMADDRLLDAWWGSREAAYLLRKRLPTAHHVQQTIVRHGFERGPSPGRLASMLAWRGIDDPTGADLASVTATWQKERLRWFRGDVPPILRPLAERLGVLGDVPTVEELELAEDHSTSVRSGWVAPKAPIGAEQWAAWKLTERVAFLRDWRPGPPTEFTDERAGLLQLIRDCAEATPQEAAEILLADIPLGAAAAIVEGLRHSKGAKDGESSLEWLETTARRFTSHAATGPADDPWHFSIEAALGELLRLVGDLTDDDNVPPVEVPRVVTAVELIAASEAVWAETDVILGQNGLTRASQNSCNALGGKLVAAIVSLGLTLYRARAEPQRVARFCDHPSGRLFAERLVPLLERVVEAEGTGGLAGRYELGRQLPGLRTLCPEWVESRLVPRFAIGISDPDADPTWPAYLIWSPVYHDLYCEWAVWYAQSAEVMPVDSKESPDEDRPFAHLLLHLTIAYMHGLVELTGEGGAVETAFRRAPPTTLSHLYWQVFRDLADGSAPPSEAVIQRLEALWTWRVAELQVSPPTEGRATEAEGLCWFAASEHVSAAPALQLATHLVPMFGTDELRLQLLWGRTTAFVHVDPSATLRLVEAMLSAHALTLTQHLALDEAREACAAIKSLVPEPEWRRFLGVVAELGRSGWSDVRKILP